MLSAEFLTFSGLDDLPDDGARLFGTADSFFASRAWWRTVLSHATPRGAEPCFVVCRVGGSVAGLFPMLHRPKQAWVSFTTPYSCLYTPLIAPGIDAAPAFETFGHFCRRRTVIRLDALPSEWPHWDAMAAGLHAAGLVHRRFGHFGNWHEDVKGLDWTGYLARRPGALRETIRRRLRRAERLPDAAFTLMTSLDGLDRGIAAFEDVYARSWKETEPFPSFNAALIRTAATAGILRLGLWSLNGHPIAAQFWIVEHGRATVLKLAHDEAFKTHSPGTVLTALMLRHFLDREVVEEIDFGRGDDPYKRDWAGQRRQRFGLLIVNPWRLGGLVALARQDLGRLLQWWRSAQPPKRGTPDHPKN